MGDLSLRLITRKSCKHLHVAYVVLRVNKLDICFYLAGFSPLNLYMFNELLDATINMSFKKFNFMGRSLLSTSSGFGTLGRLSRALNLCHATEPEVS